MLECGFQLGVNQFCTNIDLNHLFVIITVHVFSVGKVITGWAILGNGQFILLDGPSNLLGGYLPTQLTCYLPPCCDLHACSVTFSKKSMFGTVPCWQKAHHFFFILDMVLLPKIFALGIPIHSHVTF